MLSGVWEHRHRNSDSELSSEGGDTTPPALANQQSDLDDLDIRLPSPPPDLPTDSTDLTDQEVDLGNSTNQEADLGYLTNQEADQEVDPSSLINQEEHVADHLEERLLDTPEVTQRDIMDQFDPFVESSSPRQVCDVMVRFAIDH